jgi:uracil-DNA glycosylase
MAVGRDEILEDIGDYLRHMKAEGLNEIRISRTERPPLAVDAPLVAEAAVSAPPDRAAALQEIAARIAGCQDCPLSGTRTNTVPGGGCLDPDIMFIGEGPGREEDLQGIPFVGRSGALLDRLIKRMGYTRGQVFIANIVKCRATENYEMQKDRPPSTEEMSACIHYLAEQIAIVRPCVLVPLGNTALEGLFGFKGITKHRGQWLEFAGIPAMPTYHPSFLLRGGGDQGQRFWEVWEDMLQVFERLGRTPPETSLK